METVISEEKAFHSPVRGLDPVAEVISPRPQISWRAIFAGAFVAILVEMLLTALGVAVGGLGLAHVIEQGGVAGLSIGAGIWFVVSAIIALAVGSYAAARTSGLVPSRIGGIQGLVVSSMLFIALFAGIGSGLGAVGRGTTSLLGGAGRGVTDLAGNDQVQSVVQLTLGELSLRADPSVVAQEVTTRLLRGDEQGAANYLARQAGIDPNAARDRLQQITGQVASTAKEVGQSIARGTQYAGWTMFLTILLGGAAGLLGGAWGARRNFKQPMSESDWRLAAASRSQWTSRQPDPIAEAEDARSPL